MALLHQLAKHPTIAAVRNKESLELALASPVAFLFFMGGSVRELQEQVARTHAAGKGAFIHVDLVKGLANTDRESVEWLAETVRADGIVTPKAHLIKEAARCGLYAILHLFIIDSSALENGLKISRHVQPDAIEIMPGVVSKTIQTFAEELEHIPLIASGLIQTEQELSAALQAGATSLSVSSPALWSHTFNQLL